MNRDEWNAAVVDAARAVERAETALDVNVSSVDKVGLVFQLMSAIKKLRAALDAEVTLEVPADVLAALRNPEVEHPAEEAALKKVLAWTTGDVPADQFTYKAPTNDTPSTEATPEPAVTEPPLTVPQTIVDTIVVILNSVRARRLERLIALYDRQRAHWQEVAADSVAACRAQWMSAADKAQARIAKLEASNARLLKALEPFAVAFGDPRTMTGVPEGAAVWREARDAYEQEKGR